MSITFEGFMRADGTVGTRNHVAVIPSVGCAATVAQRITSMVPGCVCPVHTDGCAELGSDLQQTFRTLAGTGRNPNVGAVLVVGLGCEAVQPRELAVAIAESGKPVDLAIIQEAGGSIRTIEAGAEIARRLVGQVSSIQRRTFPLSELMLATECGGSDATSGIASNPVLGMVSDMVVAAGGTVILSETAEFMGAEHLLAARAKDPVVARRIVEIVRAVEAEAERVGANMRDSQPSPGNRAGGLTTLEEKSLGCIYKGGTTPPLEVVDYAWRPSSKGLVIMDTPGDDISSLTGMMAGGAQVAIFTTGRGTPAGHTIAPVLKMTGNPATAERMADNMDISAASVIRGEESPEAVADRLFSLLVSVCSGSLTRAEVIGHQEFSIWRPGPTV